MRTRIGLQLYSLREEMAADFLGTLAKVRDIGFDHVEFAGYGGLAAGDLRRELDRLGLTPWASHVGWQLLNDQLDEVVDYSRELGLSYVICPGAPCATLEECRNVSRLLVRAGLALQPYGIGVGYHNHERELVRFGDLYAFEEIISNRQNIPVVAEVDTCWVQYAGVDPAWFIDRLGSAAGPLHIKDLPCNYKELSRREVHCDVGAGCIDFAAVLDVARRNGILDKGLIIEQEGFSGDPYEALRNGLSHLRLLLGEPL